MTSPKLRRLTVTEAQHELSQLESGVDGGIHDFEERAHRYDLSARERGVWERISELRWLLENSRGRDVQTSD